MPLRIIFCCKKESKYPAFGLLVIGSAEARRPTCSSIRQALAAAHHLEDVRTRLASHVVDLAERQLNSPRQTYKLTPRSAAGRRRTASLVIAIATERQSHSDVGRAVSARRTT